MHPYLSDVNPAINSAEPSLSPPKPSIAPHVYRVQSRVSLVRERKLLKVYLYRVLKIVVFVIYAKECSTGNFQCSKRDTKT